MELQTVEKALEELKKQDKRKFIQTLDLIINLKNFDVRKESVNTFVTLPNPAEKRICAFLTKKSPSVDTIQKEQFDSFKDENDMKRLAKRYDFFIAVASLMPSIATKFGRILGPLGKMPSPQAGIIPSDDEEVVKKMLEKMEKMVRIRSKEKSLKIAIGKEDMENEKLKQNIDFVVRAIENILPRKNDNIKTVLIKFTMTKPIRIR